MVLNTSLAISPKETPTRTKSDRKICRVTAIIELNCFYDCFGTDKRVNKTISECNLLNYVALANN